MSIEVAVNLQLFLDINHKMAFIHSWVSTGRQGPHIEVQEAESRVMETFWAMKLVVLEVESGHAC